MSLKRMPVMYRRVEPKRHDEDRVFRRLTMNKSVNKSYLRQSVDIVMNAVLVSDFRQCKEFICLSHVGNFRG